MLSYWILRDDADAPIGLVRIDGDCVLLTASGDAARYRLFSETADTPIEPGIALRFPDAEALLGTHNGALCAFARSPQAKSLQTYRDRLSRIYTTEAEQQPPVPDAKPPRKAAEPPPAPPEEPIKEAQIFSAVSDTARETEAFSLMLRRAEAFYTRFEQFHVPAVDNMVQNEDRKPSGINLFPQLFPGARWRYVDGADLLAHYEGDYRTPSGASIRILAVRGKYAPRPPRTLMGFTRFVRAPDGAGYWLRFLPLQ